MASLHSWWLANATSQGPAPALVRVCLELALASDRATAAFLAGTALDLVPGSGEALALLERVIDPADRRLLWSRYEAFIASDAPPADVPGVRARLVSLLFELGHGYSALLAVDASLDALMADDLCHEDVRNAYAEALAEAEAIAAMEELAYYLTTCEQPLLAEAAE